MGTFVNKEISIYCKVNKCKKIIIKINFFLVVWQSSGFIFYLDVD